MVNKLEHSFKSMGLHINEHINHKQLVKKQLNQLVIKQLVKQRLNEQQLMFFKLVSIKHVIQRVIKEHIQLLVH